MPHAEWRLLSSPLRATQFAATDEQRQTPESPVNIAQNRIITLDKQHGSSYPEEPGATRLTKLTTADARRRANARKHHRGGRPRKRKRCRKCRAWCKPAREAWVHCSKPR